MEAVEENLPRDADGELLPHDTRHIRAGLDLLFADPKFAKACGQLLYERGKITFETSFDRNADGFANAVWAQYKRSKG